MNTPFPFREHGPSTGQKSPLPPIVIHALVFGIVAPLLGGLIALAVVLLMLAIFNDLSAVAGALGSVWHSLSWWVAGAYLYGLAPAVITGAVTGWLSDRIDKPARFAALALICGWVFTSLTFLFVSASPGEQQIVSYILSAFLLGAAGALATLACLCLTRRWRTF